MSLASAESPIFSTPRGGSVPAPASGGVLFVAQSRKEELVSGLRARRHLVATVGVPRAGKLREAIEEAVEGALVMRGALPPGTDVEAPLEATIRDQIFRARALGGPGLVVTLPALRAAIGKPSLSADDSFALGAWLAAGKRSPLLVLLDDADRSLPVLAPVPLAELVGAALASDDARDSEPPPSGEVAVEPPAPPPPVLAIPRRGVMKRRSLARVEAEPIAEAAPVVEAPAPVAVVEAPAPVAVVEAPVVEAAPMSEPAPMSAPLIELFLADPEPIPESAPLTVAVVAALAPPAPVEVAPASVVESPPVLEAKVEAPPAPVEEPKVEAPPAPLPRRSVLRSAAALMPSVAPAEAPAPAPRPAPPARVVHEEAAPPPSPRVEARAVVRRVVDAAELRNHAVELDKARGPKPVGVIDKLFAQRYMPLVGAIARGEADGAIKGVVESFRANFEHSYREAYAALRVTGKRPPMVFDAPEVAARIGRLNGARAVKLLLVDAMRYDVAERVFELIKDRVTGRAVCVDRSLLWAALPTNTPTQMNLLGRGADGLKDEGPQSDPEAEIARGRAVGLIRRERVGAREVMKLDLVEARLRGAGPSFEERLESIAEEVAPIVLKFIETLPHRTLLFMFGDHGFRMGASADGRSTGSATQGGCSPEEVLVPAQAWLVGGMH